jgi:hypothetical protein
MSNETLYVNVQPVGDGLLVGGGLLVENGLLGMLIP